MFDVHNHILINVDDGPKSKEEMLNLLRQAKDEGITGIVATPHHLHRCYNNEIAVVKEKIQDLKEMEEVQQLGIEIYAGQEVRLSDQILNQLDSGEIEGINRSKYILIELPTNRVPRFTQNLIYEIQNKGFVPIIVHPERNKEIAQNLDRLYDLINGGALSQLTASSLAGEFGKYIRKVSIQMIENNLVHFVASDAHNTENRPFYLKRLLYQKDAKKYTEDIEEMLENSKSIIQNQNIKKRQPIKDYKKKKILGIF
ncbi:tyrosine-protein phosphatase [Staphylococcus durrellii]|uniref:tyrosine-protein phosphatase n=1 Tax=Staphylococcus durrellii TaxID=2781773 RepID=UPI00189DD1CB|nr:CpsB/CapC family capsule biosynthesis tyrosine phosphatase [Staphylococcus durrellii]MBF7018004.1 capsular biosynthesis protein [Staphylococcus durrellii]